MALRAISEPAGSTRLSPYDLMDGRMKEFLTDLRLSGRHSSLVTGGARQHTVAHSTRFIGARTV